MIGFVGLGSMGLPIAQNICRNGFDFAFFARRPQVINVVTEMGGEFCPNMADLGEKCSVVLLFLNNATQCEECLNQILPKMTAGKIVIVGSTILPEECIHLGGLCEAQGVCLLDAPVSGGVLGASDGSLTVMVSGDREKAEQCREIMECYGKKIFYIGQRVGMAQTMKAVNQELVGINMAAVCEAYALGMRCGLNPQSIYDTISNCAGTSRIFENRSQFIISRNFDKRSSLQIHHKDLGICCHLAESVGMTLPIAALCERLYGQAMKFCDIDEDGIAVIKLFESEDNIDGTQEYTAKIRNMADSANSFHE